MVPGRAAAVAAVAATGGPGQVVAVTSNLVAVGTAATVLGGPDGDGVTLLLKNAGAAAVDLGPAGVATGAGYPLAAGDIVSVDLAPGEALYAVAASGTVNVGVLRSRVG